MMWALPNAHAMLQRRANTKARCSRPILPYPYLSYTGTPLGLTGSTSRDVQPTDVARGIHFGDSTPHRRTARSIRTGADATFRRLCGRSRFPMEPLSGPQRGTQSASDALPVPGSPQCPQPQVARPSLGCSSGLPRRLRSRGGDPSVSPRKHADDERSACRRLQLEVSTANPGEVRGLMPCAPCP